MQRWIVSALIHPRLSALALGALAACGFEPLHLWPLTLLALAGLIALIARAPDWRRVALIGWAFGVGHFTLGNNWIATTFTYQAAMPVWLGWIAVVLLSFCLALFPALAALAAWAISRRSRSTLIFAFAGCWIIAEWLRSWVFTGFAWNPIAAVALGDSRHTGLAMVAPWLGTYALSGLVVLLAGLFWFGTQLDRPRWQRAMSVALPFVFILFSGHGDGREGTLRLTLVQPDIRQEVLNEPAMFVANTQKTLRLSTPQVTGETRLVLWPESGAPDYLRDGYPERYYLDNFAADPVLARKRLGQAIGPGAMLLTGTVDLEIRDGRAVGARNAVTALDADGSIRAGYAKAHLVPFGEYLALRWLLEPLGLSRFVPGSVDFWPGSGPRTLDLGSWGRAGVQICYEIIFSGQVVDRAHRPDFIFNPTNDGWFGRWGPPQHLAQARLRAIEEGLPVLRSTTTGISAVIDADGVVRKYIPSHQAGRIDGFVPPAHPPTLFARFGNILALGWAAIFLVFSLVARRRRQS